MNNTIDRVCALEACLSQEFLTAWVFYDDELSWLQQLCCYDGLATFCMGDI